MLRWLLLSVTFAVWIASLVVIYQNYGPREVREAMPGTAHNLEALFMENAEPLRTWAIFIDPRNLQGVNSNQPPWDGKHEKEFTRIGWIETVLKRKDFTRVEQTTELQVDPAELKNDFLKQFGRITYRSRTDVSMDLGLEGFSSSFMMLGMEARMLGIRQQDEIVVNSQLSQDDKTILKNPPKYFPAGERGTPSVEVTPFGPNPNIKPGAEWDIAMLDTTFDMSKAVEPKIVARKARCTRQVTVEFQNAPVAALEVECEDGTSRAWYSPNGLVYKQMFRFLNMFDVILVREEFRTNQKNRARAARPSRTVEKKLNDD